MGCGARVPEPLLLSRCPELAVKPIRLPATLRRKPIRHHRRPRVQHRDVLGRIGNALEQQFGENNLAWLATRHLDSTQRYSFGSVRLQQGIVYRAKGGVIIGVRRPGVGPSRYEFDRFDESLVDIWIDNDGRLDHLEQRVICAMQEINLRSMAA